MPSRLVASAPRSATSAGHVAHGDVVDADAVERDGRHAGDAIGGLGQAGEVEAVRRQPEPRGILIGEHHERGAGIGHEGRRAIVDGGLEDEMTARVGLEPHLASEAQATWLALIARGDGASILSAPGPSAV